MRHRNQRKKRLLAEYFYALLLSLYPGVHRQEYGPLMLQAFKDHYRETREVQGQVGITFWLDVIADEIKSALREHIVSIQGGNVMRWVWRRQGIFFGLLLGILAITNIVWTNVLFPSFKSDDAYEITYIITIVSILLFFALAGTLASRQTNRLLSGTLAGAITAMLGFGIAMLAFFVVDNVWLDVVSHQVDKIYGFQHSAFHTMRDYINAGLLRGTVSVLPMIVVVGAVCGTLGSLIFMGFFARRRKHLSEME